MNANESAIHSKITLKLETIIYTYETINDVILLHNSNNQWMVTGTAINLKCKD